jgi:hypothetical protein
MNFFGNFSENQRKDKACQKTEGKTKTKAFGRGEVKTEKSNGFGVGSNEPPYTRERQHGPHEKEELALGEPYYTENDNDKKYTRQQQKKSYRKKKAQGQNSRRIKFCVIVLFSFGWRSDPSDPRVLPLFNVRTVVSPDITSFTLFIPLIAGPTAYLSLPLVSSPNLSSGRR